MQFTLSEIITILTCACTEAEFNRKFKAEINKAIGSKVITELVDILDDVFKHGYKRSPRSKVLILSNIMFFNKKRTKISKFTKSQVRLALTLDQRLCLTSSLLG